MEILIGSSDENANYLVMANGVIAFNPMSCTWFNKANTKEEQHAVVDKLIGNGDIVVVLGGYRLTPKFMKNVLRTEYQKLGVNIDDFIQ